MNNKSIICILSLVLNLLLSCNKDNYGFEDKVFFSSNGGEFIVVGSQYIQTLIIEDYNGVGCTSQNSFEDDYISTSYLWLTAFSKPFSNTINLIAEPNNSGKSRTLYVRAIIGNSHAEIEVTQE